MNKPAIRFYVVCRHEIASDGTIVGAEYCVVKAQNGWETRVSEWVRTAREAEAALAHFKNQNSPAYAG